MNLKGVESTIARFTNSLRRRFKHNRRFRSERCHLAGNANSGQTSIKCCDLACDVEPLPLKIYKDFTMKLEVKYFFPTSSSGAFSCLKVWE